MITKAITGDPTYDLIASVYRQALADAHSGDVEAQNWLDVCCPDWREKCPAKRRKRGKRAKKVGISPPVKFSKRDAMQPAQRTL